eukprot:2380083-Alexandrium_andersonii.AAC.1
MGHRGPAEGKLRPGPNDYRRHWDVYSEAFEFARNAIPWPRDIRMRRTDDARRESTVPAFFSS